MVTVPPLQPLLFLMPRAALPHKFTTSFPLASGLPWSIHWCQRYSDGIPVFFKPVSSGDLQPLEPVLLCPLGRVRLYEMKVIASCFMSLRPTPKKHSAAA